MYDAAMQDIHDKILVKGAKSGLTFTAELIPTHSRVAEKYVSPFLQSLCSLKGLGNTLYSGNKITLSVF